MISPPKPLLFEIIGVEVLSSEKTIPLASGTPPCPIRFKVDASLKSAELLIELVMNGYDLSFYDPKHPSLTSPGATIILKPFNGGILCRRENLGWTSSWLAISPEEAALYLYHCIPDNQRSVPPAMTLQSTDHKKALVFEKNDRLRKYLNVRLDLKI